LIKKVTRYICIYIYAKAILTRENHLDVLTYIFSRGSLISHIITITHLDNIKQYENKDIASIA
jgi:hypothetical protein